MPKFDFILKPGESIPEELVSILEQRITPSLRQKLLKHGGLIRLSIASPYVDRKQGNQGAPEINAELISELETISQKPDRLRERLAVLSVKQLNRISVLLKLHVRSSASSREIRDAIIRRLQSGQIWEDISRSGNHPSTE